MSTKLSKLFITGFDTNTQWQYQWFKEQFHAKVPGAKLKAYNFDWFDTPISGVKNWFKKPFAMLDAATQAEEVCWIDTDCEIREDISDIFNYIVPNKLAMVEDVPWSMRRGEKWHNSGVVAFEGVPDILRMWCTAVQTAPIQGDQETLHLILRQDLKRLIHITDLPREYNTLRLDLTDGTAPPNIKVMHWTGPAGKEVIKEMINV